MSHTFDPSTTTPLNIAVKDTDETMVDMIVTHDFSDPKDKKWLMRWITEPPCETWETPTNVREPTNVDAFHHHCATNKLDLLTETNATVFHLCTEHVQADCYGPGYFSAC